MGSMQHSPPANTAPLRRFDIEIGEMFGGRALSPDTSWQAQAYRPDLKGALT